MKTTTWLFPLLVTVLFATRQASSAPRHHGYPPMEMANTNSLMDDYYFVKRNKPSLSIVNPLDVLRNRLLLEMARRQMKENSKQVEANRLILKTVGKRMSTPGQSYRLAQLRNDLQQFRKQQDMERLQEEEYQRDQEQLQEHFPKHFEYLPTVTILELLEILQNQPQQQPQQQEAQLSDNYDFDDHFDNLNDEISNSVKKSQDMDEITINPINVNAANENHIKNFNGNEATANFNKQQLMEHQQQQQPLQQQLGAHQEAQKQQQQQQQELQQGQDAVEQQQPQQPEGQLPLLLAQNGDNSINGVNAQGMLRANANADNADAFKWHYYYRLHNNRLIK